MMLPGYAARVPDKPLRTVWVKVVADQHYSRQSSWEKKARRELDEVADLLAEHLGIRLEVLTYEYWYHEKENDLKILAAQMIEEVEFGQADILIGFTLRSGSRHMKSLRNDGVTLAFQGMMLKVYQGAPDHNYFLPIIILHEMVHMFGGVHTNDGSLMSPQLEQGIKLKLDPLNHEIVQLTRDIEFRRGYASLEPAAVARLAALYEQAIADGNDEIPTYLELGAMYMTLEQYGRAIEPYRRIVEFTKELGYAWLHWGDCHYKLDRPDSAIAVYEAALEHVDDKGLFCQRLAILYYNKSEYEKSYRFAMEADKYATPVSPGLWRKLKQIKESSKL